MLCATTPDPITLEELRSIEHELERELSAPFDFTSFRRAFRGSPNPYNLPPQQARAAVEAHPERIRPACVKLALVRTLIRFQTPPGRSVRYPESVQEQYAVHLALTAKDLRRKRESYYTLEQDTLLKDLALFDERMLPGGAQLFETNRGVPRRILAAGGLRQGLRAARRFFPCKGTFGPFFEMHTDPRRMNDFFPASWEKFYSLVAEMLQQRPEVRGLFGGGWWNDPAVGEVSPHLAYLRQTPVDNGAETFFYRFDESSRGNALVYSRERRAAYESGLYRPATHVLVWGRRELLEWARNHSNSD